MKTVTYAVEGYKPPITAELRVLVDCHRTEGNSRDFIVYTVRKYGVNKPSVGNTGFMGKSVWSSSETATSLQAKAPLISEPKHGHLSCTWIGTCVSINMTYSFEVLLRSWSESLNNNHLLDTTPDRHSRYLPLMYMLKNELIANLS